MSFRSLTIWIAGAAAFAVCAGAALALPTEQQLRGCRAIADIGARVSCYDRLVDQPQTMAAPQAPMAPASPAPPGASAPAAPAPVAAAPAQPPMVAQTSENLISGDVGKVYLTIADVTVTGDERRIVMTMSDGTVWQQTDPKKIKTWPKVGDKVKVRDAMMGYWCELNARDVFHCRPKTK